MARLNVKQRLSEHAHRSGKQDSQKLSPKVTCEPYNTSYSYRTSLRLRRFCSIESIVVVNENMRPRGFGVLVPAGSSNISG